MITPDDFASIAMVAIGKLVPTAPSFSDPYVAQAVSGGILVQLQFAPSTGEWTFQLGQGGQADPLFEIPDLLRITNCPEHIWRPLSTVISQDPAAAHRVLLQASTALRTFGSAYLVGEDRAFAAARLDRSERAAAYTEEVNQGPAIGKANAAWAAGDLPGVVEALAPFRGHLPPNQERRLAYADRKMVEGNST